MIKITIAVMRILSRFPLQAPNTSRPRQNGRHFPDNIFKCIFLNENVQFAIKISLKSVPNGTINNITELVQMIAWHRTGDKPLSEPMMVSILSLGLNDLNHFGK